jgi:hypothetical protein
LAKAAQLGIETLTRVLAGDQRLHALLDDQRDVTDDLVREFLLGEQGAAEERVAAAAHGFVAELSGDEEQSSAPVEEIEPERRAKRARLLREQKTLARELPGQLAKRDEEALAREERMTTSFRAALAAQAEALTGGFQATLAKRDEELQLALAKRDDEHKELQVAREERMMTGFHAALAAQAKALTDGFQAALAERDDELRALAARDAEAVAAATEGVGAKVDVLDSRVAAAVPPTVNLNAAASKAPLRAAAPWPPAEQRATAEEAQRCIGLSGFLKRMKLESVSKYLGIFGAVVVAKACAAWPGERELKYVVQNARVQAIYDDEELLEEAFQDCKPHFDDVTDGKGGWKAIGVNDFTSARAWRNEEALSSYIKCLMAVAVVYAKKKKGSRRPSLERRSLRPQRARAGGRRQGLLAHAVRVRAALRGRARRRGRPGWLSALLAPRASGAPPGSGLSDANLQ